MIKEVYFGNSNDINEGKEIRKSDICKKLGADLLVDDQLEHAEDCARVGIEVLLYNSPWNQGIPLCGVTRVYSWHDIIDKIS